jgi:hypothetical protein
MSINVVAEFLCPRACITCVDREYERMGVKTMSSSCVCAMASISVSIEIVIAPKKKTQKRLVRSIRVVREQILTCAIPRMEPRRPVRKLPKTTGSGLRGGARP